jgi:hypothetical protein
MGWIGLGLWDFYFLISRFIHWVAFKEAVGSAWQMFVLGRALWAHRYMIALCRIAYEC